MTRPRTGRLRGVLTLLVALIVVGLLSSLPFDLGGVRWYEGRAGEPVDAQAFRVSVARVGLARTVQLSSATVTTDQTYVLVRVRYDIRRRPGGLGEVRLVTADGYRYAPLTATGTYSIAPPPVEPGYTTSGVLVFEVPADKAVGASMEFQNLVVYTHYRPAARVADVVTASTERAPDDTFEVGPEVASVEVTP